MTLLISTRRTEDAQGLLELQHLSDMRTRTNDPSAVVLLYALKMIQATKSRWRSSLLLPEHLPRLVEKKM